MIFKTRRPLCIKFKSNSDFSPPTISIQFVLIVGKQKKRGGKVHCTTKNFLGKLLSKTKSSFAAFLESSLNIFGSNFSMYV